jgi:uncharacterized membrane protein (DUF4010 family)
MPEWSNAFAPYAGLALALALGLLIGVERGWSHRNVSEGGRVAGIRTFALLGLLGGMAAETAKQVSPLFAVVLLAGCAAALLIGYAKSAKTGELSATTTIVGVITLGLGVLAASGQMIVASMAAAVVTLLLAQRRQLHEWVGRLTEVELHAIARFGLIALVVLPLLPDRAIGPLEAWNPRQIWMVVVLVSGLSLVGYAASKLLGESKGVLATAAAGALVSSTAVTAAFAARLRKGEGREASLIAGIALASAVMFVRVLVIVGLLASFALPALALVAVPAGLVSAVFLAWSLRGLAKERDGDPGAPPMLRNPFDLAPALILAGFVMIISMAGRWALDRFGDAGLAVVLGISGLVDVDAAVVAMSGPAANRLSPGAAGAVLAAPILANTLVKAGLVLTVARGSAGWRGAVPLLLSLAAGLGGLALIPIAFPGKG